MGMDCLAGEFTREVRVAGIPVVAIADNQQIEFAGGPVLVGDVPVSIRVQRGVLDAVVELDVLQQPEGLRIGVQVGLDVTVVRERGGEMVRDRKVLEGQPLFGGVDMQRTVGAAQPVRVRESPVATDAVGQLEGGVGHAVVLEHLARCQPADARADDGGARQGLATCAPSS